MHINFDTILQEGMTHASDHKTWGGHDRSKTVGASEVGQCLRKTVYAKHGVEQDANFSQSFGAAVRGDVIEQWLEKLLSTYLPKGVSLIWSGAEQKTLVHGYTSATPDGLFVAEKPFTFSLKGKSYTTNCLYNEIKSIDPRPFDNLDKPRHNHVLQVHQGMHLTYVGSKGKYAPKFGILFYVNASFLDQVKMFVVERDAEIALSLEARANSVFNLYSADNLPTPEGKVEGGKECMYCPWKNRCTKREVDLIPTNTHSNFQAGVLDRLEELAVTRKRNYAEMKDLEKLVKDTDQEIFSTMRDADSRKVEGDWGSVTVFSAKSPPRYNKELFEKKGLDPKDFQVEGEYSPRLNISLKS